MGKEGGYEGMGKEGWYEGVGKEGGYEGVGEEGGYEGVGKECYVTVGTFARRGLSSTAKTLRSLSGVRGSEY